MAWLRTAASRNEGSSRAMFVDSAAAANEGADSVGGALRHNAAQTFGARLPQISVDAFEQVIKYALPLFIGL